MKRPLRSRLSVPTGVPGPETAPASVPLGGGRGEAMRRLQIGASGVAAVLVLIGLASIVKDRASETDAAAVAGAAPTASPPAPSDAADPLAEAGVVPEIPDATAPSSGPSAAGGGASPVPPTDAR